MCPVNRIIRPVAGAGPCPIPLGPIQPRAGGNRVGCGGTIQRGQPQGGAPARVGRGRRRWPTGCIGRRHSPGAQSGQVVMSDSAEEPLATSVGAIEKESVVAIFMGIPAEPMFTVYLLFFFLPATDTCHSWHSPRTKGNKRGQAVIFDILPASCSLLLLLRALCYRRHPPQNDASPAAGCTLPATPNRRLVGAGPRACPKPFGPIQPPGTRESGRTRWNDPKRATTGGCPYRSGTEGMQATPHGATVLNPHWGFIYFYGGMHLTPVATICGGPLRLPFRCFRPAYGSELPAARPPLSRCVIDNCCTVLTYQALLDLGLALT